MEDWLVRKQEPFFKKVRWSLIWSESELVEKWGFANWCKFGRLASSVEFEEDKDVWCVRFSHFGEFGKFRYFLKMLSPSRFNNFILSYRIPTTFHTCIKPTLLPLSLRLPLSLSLSLCLMYKKFESSPPQPPRLPCFAKIGSVHGKKMNMWQKHDAE